MDMISEVRDSWGWVGIDPVEIVSENDFGNLIIRENNSTFWRLCPEDVYCEVIAKNTHELDELFKDQEFIVDWNMSTLVDAAQNSIGFLTEGRKYCLVVSAIFGGAYDVSNIKSVPLVELIRFSGDIGKQVRDLPDGQQIELKIID